MVRAVAERALARQGYDVDHRQRRRRGARRSSRPADDFDLVVSDVVMPSMDGPAMAREIRKLHRDLPVLFMSGYAEEQLRNEIDIEACTSSPSRSACSKLPTRWARCWRTRARAASLLALAVIGAFMADTGRDTLYHGCNTGRDRQMTFRNRISPPHCWPHRAGAARFGAAGRTETAQGDVSVTIYQNGQALVQDIRQLDIARGTQPDRISRCHRRRSAPTRSASTPTDTAIVEQNFDFDLLTPTKLMEKAIGQHRHPDPHQSRHRHRNPRTRRSALDRRRRGGADRRPDRSAARRRPARARDVRRSAAQPARPADAVGHARNPAAAARALPRSAISPPALAGPPITSRCSTRRMARSTCRAGSR